MGGFFCRSVVPTSSARVFGLAGAPGTSTFDGELLPPHDATKAVHHVSAQGVHRNRITISCPMKSHFRSGPCNRAEATDAPAGGSHADTIRGIARCGTVQIYVMQSSRRGALITSATFPLTTLEVAMNVSLDKARSQARLDWDVLEARNKRATSLPRRAFGILLAALAAYMLWNY